MRFCKNKLAVIILVLLFVCPAYADQVAAPDFICDPGDEGGNSLAFGGKPVSLVSGVETFSRIDLTLGSLYPINVQRRYNSSSGYDSPLGYGWALNHDKRLYTYADGSVTLRKECGWKIRFTWSVANGYQGTTGETGALIQNADGSYHYTDKYGEKETYDPQGRITKKSDTKGNSLVYTYRAATRDFLWGILPFNLSQTNSVIVAYDYHLSKIEEKDASGNPTGVSMDLQYELTTGRLTGLSDSAGRTVSYGHDSIGNLTSVSGPSGNAAYSYADATRNHLLTSIDEGKGVYVNTYDSTGRVVKQTRGTGELTFEYVDPYKKTRMTTLVKDGSGNLLNSQTRTMEFDSNGQASKATDAFGNVVVYTRNSNMLITREEYWENTGSTGSPNLALRTAREFTYDARGNLLTKTEAQGTAVEQTTIYTYHPVFNGVTTETVLSIVDPAQSRIITTTHDDANGNMLTSTETGLLGDGTPYSYTTTYTYNANGKLETVDGPRTDVNDVTTYYYDPLTGYLNGVTQPLAGTSSYSNFDSLGNPQTVTDPNGNTTTYTYDSNGRVASVKAAGDTAATQYFYVGGGCGSGCSGGGKIDHITLPEGNTIWYTYDAMGNLSAIKDNANNSINYTYDSAGNRLTEQIKDSTGSLQKSLSYSYDALNRTSKITSPDNNYTQYGYDGFGNRKSVKDPNGNTTTYTYDSLNRIASTLQPLNASTSYTYNSNSNLATVKDANNNTTTYNMDDKGRVYQTISPDSGTTTYQYDSAGNIISKTDAKGVTISYQYDALNRLTKVDYPTDVDTIYVYDNCVNGKGRVCSITDASGTTVYEYWPKGQVKKKTTTTNGVQQVIQYAYDQNRNLKTITEPTGEVITYNYSNNKAVSVLDNAANLATSINYKPFGGISSLSYGNGIAGSIGYDNQYRITGITAGTVMNLSYPNYDANANIMAINNTLDPTKNKSFGYDALDRLTSATASGLWGSLSWTYDSVGNRLTENANSYTYTAGTNKLSSANGLSYGFDNNGNTTSQGARQYTYNENQRLVQVVDGAMTATYTYNGLGQRVKKVVNGVMTIFHYDQRGQLIAESNGSGTITAVYVYLNGLPLAKIEGTNVYYYHNDALGTPQKMTDATGAVVWSADYKPFGEATITVSTITNNLRGIGQYFDAETGLLYNYFRDLNPATGRYNEKDPIGIRGGINLYRFVKNNPLKYKDPRGLVHCQFNS